MIELLPPIVVVAYNRPRSLKRILSSLDRAYYPDSEIQLIISIDKAEDNLDVLDIANNYKWSHGTKTINYQDNNLGLKKHILKCGALSKKFGSIIILEDDLYVSPNFYFYASKALTFSIGKSYIGGISLYNHMLNVHTRNHFTPYEDGFDNWYFQFASSWGQAWTKEHWIGFEEWYAKNPEIEANEKIPNNILTWSDKSWLKYYIAYLIETNKYFLYPKSSLSTNFSDVGTHMGRDIPVYQVPLFFGKKKEYNFSTLNLSNSIYDAFFENISIIKHLENLYPSLCIDLYGSKLKYKERYLLTTKIIDHRVVKTFGMSFKPIDVNIFEDIDGNDIFLYDTKFIERNKVKRDFTRRFNYEIKHISYKSVRKIFLQMTYSKFKKLFSRILKIN